MKRMQIKWRVHPAGWGVLVMLLLFSRSAAVLAMIPALLLHEAAHILAMAAVGVRRVTVELTPFGGMADAPDYERLPALKQALVAISGVLVSTAAWLLTQTFAPKQPFWFAFGNMNLCLAVLNCLPVWPLDGARAALAMASCLGGVRTLRRAMLWLAYTMGIGMVALALWGVWQGHVNVSLLALGPYLIYAAHQSAISNGVRGMQRVRTASSRLGEEPMPARVLVCADEPTASTLTRLMSRMPERAYHLLCIVDRERGSVRRVMTEAELSKRLFEE